MYCDNQTITLFHIALHPIGLFLGYIWIGDKSEMMIMKLWLEIMMIQAKFEPMTPERPDSECIAIAGMFRLQCSERMICLNKVLSDSICCSSRLLLYTLHATSVSDCSILSLGTLFSYSIFNPLYPKNIIFICYQPSCK